MPSRLLVALLCSLTAPQALGATQRLALVVGHNAGRGALPPLRYAEADAGKVARVLLELGDVAPDHLVLLQGQGAAAVEAAVTRLRALAERLKRGPDQVAVLFFYSGHSDGEGLELGDELLPFGRLKALLAGTGADVRVLIVDACRSGAAAREKGGRKAEAFTIALTDTLQTSGEALIASSAEDEAALESSEVMGSVFTHHLVSGLRGAADVSGDKLVTLGEAYRYAYQHTVSRTTLAPSGVQHPTYDYHLTGQGELVLTALERASGALRLPSGVERAVVTDVLRDQVLAELPPGVTEVALPPGQYGVRLFREGSGYGGRVTVAAGAPTDVTWAQLERVPSSTPFTRKGPTVTAAVGASDWERQRGLTLLGGVAPTIAGLGATAQGRLAFEPRLGWGVVGAAQVAFMQVAAVSELQLEGRFGWRFSWRFGPAWVAAGAEAGVGVVTQNTGQVVLASPTGSLAARVLVRLLVGDSVLVSLEGELAGVVAQAGGALGLFARPGVLAGLGWRF